MRHQDVRALELDPGCAALAGRVAPPPRTCPGLDRDVPDLRADKLHPDAPYQIAAHGRTVIADTVALPSHTGPICDR